MLNDNLSIMNAHLQQLTCCMPVYFDKVKFYKSYFKSSHICHLFRQVLLSRENLGSYQMAFNICKVLIFVCLPSTLYIVHPLPSPVTEDVSLHSKSVCKNMARVSGGTIRKKPKFCENFKNFIWDLIYHVARTRCNTRVSLATRR